MFYHFYEGFQGTGRWSKALYYLIETGWAGVDLFFVLSSFLITRILLEAKGQPHYFRNFYFRRVLRIFPLYYFSLILMVYCIPLLWPNWEASDIVFYRTHSLWVFAHAINLISFFTNNGGFLFHYWSLSIEEQFYLLWPMLIFFVPNEKLPRACLALGMIAVLFRGAGLIAGFKLHGLHLLLPARLDTLAIGASLAYLERIGRLPSAKKLAPFAIGAFLLTILPLALGDRFPAARWFRQTFYFTTLAGIFAVYILAVLESRPGSGLHRIMSSAVLRKFGKHSYSLYIFHTVIMHSFPLTPSQFLKAVPYVLPAGILYAIAVGSVTFVVSLLTWQLVEMPFLSLKKYFRFGFDHGGPQESFDSRRRAA